MTQNINYRGVTISRKELAERVDQLQQRQGARHIHYRGAEADEQLNQAHQPQKRSISYRGATAEIEV